MSILVTLAAVVGLIVIVALASMLLYVLYRIYTSGATKEAGEEFLIGRIQGARQNYHDSLENLKHNRHDEKLRQTALERGMRYGELMNKYLERTLYDEELHSPILYGLLAHSHGWKGAILKTC